MKIYAIDIWTTDAGRDCYKVTVDLGPLSAKGHDVCGLQIRDAWVSRDADRKFLRENFNSLLGKEVTFETTWHKGDKGYVLNIDTINLVK